MKNNSNHNSFGVILLTILFPFIGLIYCLYHWRKPWAKNVFWLVCIYLGVVFIYCPEGTVLGSGLDAGRLVLTLYQMHGSSVSLSGILGQYLIDQHTMDLYQPLTTFFISRFTDNGHVLFGFFAVVFGFFYSRNIWYVLEKLPGNKLGGIFILVALFFLTCPITQINGVRMWTALHVYVYALMPYLLERDKTKFWWVMITPLIHFSFLYITIFALVWYMLPYGFKTRNSLFITAAFVLFVLSWFINSLNLDSVGGVLAEYSPDSYEERIQGYVNEDVLNRNSEANALNNWYVAASGSISTWCYNLLLLVLLPCLKRNFRKNEGIMHLFVFTLFIGSIANITALIPSGGRFMIVSQMFKVSLVLLVVMNISHNDRYRKFVNISLFFLIIPLIVEFRKLFDYFGISAVLGDYFTALIWEDDVPLITFLKNII